MKSFSKRVASFTMAAAMVLSLAAVSPVDAQAAKKASITKKTSITAGKTYTYKIKNVTSKQYVKVTGITSGVKVKYNNKTVKKNSTKIYGKKSGAALALKVTAKDKVANYKATIKAQVYNKSNNKKVGSLLKTTTKVKCTKLAVTDVAVASTSGKYLVAKFSKALSKLSVADLTIRNTATGELKGVEKVELASDGKSATVTLVGSEDSNSNGVTNSFIVPNVDYSFSVAQSGATATTTFSVDAIEAGVTVIDYDVANKKITTTYPLKKNTNTGKDANGWGPGATTVSIPENVYSGDYEKLLGTTVTVAYDKNNNATKLTSAKETVVYGSFKYVTANTATPYFENVATKDKYYEQSASGDLWASEIINENGGLVNPVNSLTNGTIYDYAKVVLYNNGCVKTVTGIRKFDGNILVDKVEETAVSAGTKTVINLKDFKIIKDGELSSVAAIAAGDVVFYDTANKLAEIYNDKVESTLQAAYAGSYKFNDTLYNYTIDGVTVKYVDGSNGVKDAKNETMESFLKGGPAIKVYFDRAKRPVFVEGTKAAADPSDTFAVVLTAGAQHYRTSLDNIIRLKGYNGTSIATYNINVADLTKIATSANYIYETTGDASAVTGNETTKKYVVTGFSANNTEFSIENANAVVSCNNVSSNIAAVEARVLVSTNEIVEKQLVELTTNKDGKVTGISLKSEVGTVSGNFGAGASNVKVDNGSGVETSYQISASTPVYVYTNSTTVSKVTYDKFTGKVTDGNAHVYSSNGKDVAYVVVEDVEADTIKYVQAVVSRADKTADGKKIANLIAFTTEGQVEYSAFTETAAKTTVNVNTGDVIRIGLGADGKTVESIDVTDCGTVTSGTVSHNTVNANEGKYVRVTSGNDCPEELASSVAPIIVKIVKNGQDITSVEKVNFSELYNLDSQNVSFTIKTTTLGNTAYIDTIVITVN